VSLLGWPLLVLLVVLVVALPVATVLVWSRVRGPRPVRTAARLSLGRVESVTITGVRSRLASHAFVYLPPQYFQAAYRRRAFPAAQVFTGFPGTDLNLLKGLDFPGRLLDEMKAHRARPTVLVMMRPSVNFPRDTECTDVPSGPQALAFFAQDVPLAIAGTYRVQTRGWGAIGDSTGGYCAAKLAMLHSDVFTAAVALSGYFHPARRHHRRPVGRIPGAVEPQQPGMAAAAPAPTTGVAAGHHRQGRGGLQRVCRQPPLPRPRAHRRGPAARGRPDPPPRRPQLQHLGRRAAPGPQLALTAPTRTSSVRLRAASKQRRRPDAVEPIPLSANATQAFPQDVPTVLCRPYVAIPEHV
jgi:hypothetical protein